MTDMEKKLAFLLSTSPFLDTVNVSWEKAAWDLARNGVVPVVRCKDCKHSYKGSPHGLMCECPVGGQNTSLLSGDDFCSCGERRADDDQA